MDPNQCTECTYPYPCETPEVIAEHAEWHRRWIEGVETLGYRPPTRAELEENKRRGRHAMCHGATVAEQLHGAETFIGGHRDRAIVEDIEGGELDGIPSLAEYIAMIDLPERVFPKHIIEALRAKYGEAPGSKLEFGCSWRDSHMYHLPGRRFWWDS